MKRQTSRNEAVERLATSDKVAEVAEVAEAGDGKEIIHSDRKPRCDCGTIAGVVSPQ